MLEPKLKQELDEIIYKCSLKNWDGYGAKPISTKSISFTLDFLGNLGINKIHHPKLVPEPNGELGMLWEGSKGSLVISINKDSILTYAGITKDGKKIKGHMTFKGHITKNLLKIIKFFA